MPASNAKSGMGTQFQRGDGATPENFTTVSEQVKIDGPTEKADTADVTNMDSPNNYREYISTLLEGGEVQLEMNYIPGSASQQGLRSDYTGRQRRNFKILVPDGSGGTAATWSFAAVVTEMTRAYEVDKAMRQTVKLKVSGAPTVA